MLHLCSTLQMCDLEESNNLLGNNSLLHRKHGTKLALWTLYHYTESFCPVCQALGDARWQASVTDKNRQNEDSKQDAVRNFHPWTSCCAYLLSWEFTALGPNRFWPKFPGIHWLKRSSGSRQNSLKRRGLTPLAACKENESCTFQQQSIQEKASQIGFSVGSLLATFSAIKLPHTSERITAKQRTFCSTFRY